MSHPYSTELIQNVVKESASETMKMLVRLPSRITDCQIFSETESSYKSIRLARNIGLSVFLARNYCTESGKKSEILENAESKEVEETVAERTIPLRIYKKDMAEANKKIGQLETQLVSKNAMAEANKKIGQLETQLVSKNASTLNFILIR